MESSATKVAAVKDGLRWEVGNEKLKVESDGKARAIPDGIGFCVSTLS